MTKLDAYEKVIEVLKSGDCWLKYYRDWVIENSYKDDILYELQDLGIVEIKLEVDEYKLEEFKEVVEGMKEYIEENKE